jgi:Protein of unknown function (DUF3618)
MDQDTSQVRHEVEQAREQLGDTVEALAYKANAPKRAKDHATTKVDAVKAAATTKAHEAKQRIDETKTRISTDPRARKAKEGIGTAKETIANARDGDTPRTAKRGAARVQPVLNTVKRHPTTTAAAATAAVAGILIGRISARN